MFQSHKHSFLHAETPVDPRIINRCVDKAMEKPALDVFDLMPPFNRVTSNQPCIPIPYCDVTKRRLGFGRWGLPKLKRELHSNNLCTVKQALETLCDVVHDPERNYEAIKLRFPHVMHDLLVHEDPSVRERTLIALTTMGNLLDGKNAVVKNKRIMENIQVCMNDAELAVRVQVYTLLCALSSVWMVADNLVEFGFVELLIQRLRIVYETEDICVIVLLLETLENLLYCNGKFLALESGLYCLLLDVLGKHCNEEVIGKTLKVISVLTQTDEGKEIALQTKLLKKVLYGYIRSEIPVIYENAAAAMLFATIKTEALVKAIKLPKLVDRLLELAKDVYHPTTQKYCLQILANLTGHGKIKHYLLEERVDEIIGIPIGNDEHAKRVKEILLVDCLKFG